MDFSEKNVTKKLRNYHSIMDSESTSQSNVPQDQPVITGSIDLPPYFPLNQNLVKDFERCARLQTKVDQTIKESINNILSQTKEYLKFVLDDENLTNMDFDSKFFSYNLATLEELLKSQHESGIWKKSVEESKIKIRLQQRQEVELNLESLEYYQNQVDDVHFGDLVKKEYEEYRDIHHQETSFQTVLATNDAYKYLKNVTFILQNPQHPLPEEAEDDELEVAGGKISLKDPLSLNYFHTPLVSKKCGHIFEEDTITDYLSNHNKCPVDGCGAVLTRNDLKPDDIMTLRVKVYLLQNKTKRPQANVDRL